MEDTDSFKNKHIYKYLNNSVEIDGANKQSVYEQIINVADSAYREYEMIYRELISLKDKFHENTKIEHLLQSNLFVRNYTQNAISQGMLESIKGLLEATEKRIHELKTWYNKNQTLFEYQSNVQKNKGSAA